jgi:hypothetical protein
MADRNTSPRPMLPPENTGKESVFGRTVWRDQNTNEEYSEKSKSFNIGESWYVLPSVDEKGFELSEDQLRERVAKGLQENPDTALLDPITKEKFPVFGSESDATAYSKWRSANMYNPGAKDYDYKPVSSRNAGYESLRGTDEEKLKDLLKAIGMLAYMKITGEQIDMGTFRDKVGFDEGGLTVKDQMSRMLPGVDDDTTPSPQQDDSFGSVALGMFLPKIKDAKSRFVSAGTGSIIPINEEDPELLKGMKRVNDYFLGLGASALEAADATWALTTGVVGEVAGSAITGPRSKQGSRKRLAGELYSMPDAFAGMIGPKSIQMLDDAIDSVAASVTSKFVKGQPVEKPDTEVETPVTPVVVQDTSPQITEYDVPEDQPPYVSPFKQTTLPKKKVSPLFRPRREEEPISLEDITGPWDRDKRSMFNKIYNKVSSPFRGFDPSLVPASKIATDERLQEFKRANEGAFEYYRKIVNDADGDTQKIEAMLRDYITRAGVASEYVTSGNIFKDYITSFMVEALRVSEVPGANSPDFLQENLGNLKMNSFDQDDFNLLTEVVLGPRERPNVFNPSNQVAQRNYPGKSYYDEAMQILGNQAVDSSSVNFYSPVVAAIENLPMKKEGMLGSQIIKFLEKRAPNVSKPEVTFASNNVIKPNRVYTKEEITALLNDKMPKYGAYFLRYPQYENMQRVVYDPNTNLSYQAGTINPDKFSLVDYFELVVNQDKPTGFGTHYYKSKLQGQGPMSADENLLHARGSVVLDKNTNEQKIVIEEMQSDVTQNLPENKVLNQNQYVEKIQDSFYGLNKSINEILSDVLKVGDNWTINTSSPDTLRFNDVFKNIEDDNLTLFTPEEIEKITAVLWPIVSKRPKNKKEFLADERKYAADDFAYEEELADELEETILKIRSILPEGNTFGTELLEQLNTPYSVDPSNNSGTVTRAFMDSTGKRGGEYNPILRALIEYKVEQLPLSPQGINHVYDTLGLNEKSNIRDNMFANVGDVRKPLFALNEQLYNPSTLPTFALSRMSEAKDVTLNRNTDAVRLAMLSIFKKAKEQGINKVIIPSPKILGDRRSGFNVNFKDVYDLLENQPKSRRSSMRKRAKRDAERTLELKAAENALKPSYVDIPKKVLRILENELNISLPIKSIPLEVANGVNSFATDSGLEIDISNFEIPEDVDFRFAKGGYVNTKENTMDKQMSLFAYGGLKDDGMDRDPVSGNEVPPGSLASEVRDDIPAQLSEGEYVVPADVVRYYGVEHFENLRNQAKQGLTNMEANGRIGGQPVQAAEGGMIQSDFSVDDEQFLKSILGVSGYAPGGMVYNNQPLVNAPVNTGVYYTPVTQPAVQPVPTAPNMQPPVQQPVYQPPTGAPAGYGISYSPTTPVSTPTTPTTPTPTEPESALVTKFYIHKDGRRIQVLLLNGKPISGTPADFSEFVEDTPENRASIGFGEPGDGTGGDGTSPATEGATGISDNNDDDDYAVTTQGGPASKWYDDINWQEPEEDIEDLTGAMSRTGIEAGISTVAGQFLGLPGMLAGPVMKTSKLADAHAMANIYQAIGDDRATTIRDNINTTLKNNPSLRTTYGTVDAIFGADGDRKTITFLKDAGVDVSRFKGKRYKELTEAMDDYLAEVPAEDAAKIKAFTEGTKLDAAERKVGTVGATTRNLNDVQAEINKKIKDATTLKYDASTGSVKEVVDWNKANVGDLVKEREAIKAGGLGAKTETVGRAPVTTSPAEDKTPVVSSEPIVSETVTRKITGTNNRITIKKTEPRIDENNNNIVGSVSEGGQYAGDGFEWKKNDGGYLTRVYTGANEGSTGSSDSTSTSSNEDSSCCFIMLEARYGNGTMDKVVRKYRDEYMTDRNRRGYYRLAEVLVPLMRKSPAFKWVITKTFADPLVSYGKYYYGENKHGVVFTPVKNFWMKVFDIVGGNTKFIRENGEVV